MVLALFHMSARNSIDELPTLERLTVLVKLQESNSLLEAAGHDPIKQSRYSHYLKDLSGQFTAKLTERHGRTLRLTPAGHQLANIARQQIQTLEAFRQSTAKTVHEWSIGSDDSLLGGIVIPALARNRRRDEPRRYRLLNLPAVEIATQLTEGRLEFGLLGRDALPDAVTAIDVCSVRYIVLVPNRLVPGGGMLSLRSALLDCPHAAVGGDEIFMEKVRRIARKTGANYLPELLCNTLSECMAAVRTGCYAAIVPSYFVDPNDPGNWHVLEDEGLRELQKNVTLAWNPGTIEIQGKPGRKMKDELISWLRDEAVQHE